MSFLFYLADNEEHDDAPGARAGNIDDDGDGDVDIQHAADDDDISSSSDKFWYRMHSRMHSGTTLSPGTRTGNNQEDDDDDDYDYDENNNNNDDEDNNNNNNNHDDDDDDVYSDDDDDDEEYAPQDDQDDDEIMLAHQNCISEIQEIISSSGLENYLLRSKDKTPNDANTAIMRVSSFLNWCYGEQNLSSGNLPTTKVMKFFTGIVLDHYELLHKYCIYLQENRRFVASTVKNYLADIAVAAKWLIYYFGKGGHYNKRRLHSADAFMFIEEIKTLSRVLNNKDKKQRKRKNMAQSIAERRQPARGIAELLAAVKSQLPWARSIVDANVLEKSTFTKFMHLFFASLYAGDYIL